MGKLVTHLLSSYQWSKQFANGSLQRAVCLLVTPVAFLQLAADGVTSRATATNADQVAGSEQQQSCAQPDEYGQKGSRHPIASLSRFGVIIGALDRTVLAPLDLHRHPPISLGVERFTDDRLVFAEASWFDSVRRRTTSDNQSGDSLSSAKAELEVGLFRSSSVGVAIDQEFGFGVGGHPGGEPLSLGLEVDRHVGPTEREQHLEQWWAVFRRTRSILT